jgi:outer membrane receptor protein involved in Fe transport
LVNEVVLKVTAIILSQLLSLSLVAQDNASITGIIKENGHAVEFANVYITAANDSSKIVAATVSDTLGKFRLENLSVGNYALKVQMLGYITRTIPQKISSTDKQLDMGDINIEPDPLVLEVVEVNAMRNIIQKTDDGFIVNTSSNITQIGGTAADLLRNMPGVLVSAEGELTLRGKTPLTLINGRISGITGVDRSAQLERIPASSIEKIEIINNPSAKYDADAEGGIINIILKKSEGNGTNGAFAVGAGKGDRYRLNASALLNHKIDKWNFGIAYDNWYTTRTRSVKGDRINYELPDEYYLTQRRFDERLIFYQNAKANVDFTPNEKNSWNFEALWAFPGEDNNETLTSTYHTFDETFTSKKQRHSNEIRRSHALEFSLNYRKRFDDPDKVLLGNISNTFGNDKENTDIDTQPLDEQEEELGDPYLQRTHTYQNTNLTNISLDFSRPVSETSILDAGYKSIFRFLNTDYERANEEDGVFVIDPLNTNVFDFREQIHAIYTQYTGWTGEKDTPKWKYSVGVRAEQVWNNGSTRDESTNFTNEYFKLYPSASIHFYTPKRNDLKISYSRRINRPSLGQLNPFTDITDSLNQRAGNPDLQPELIHSMELGYSHSIQNASVSLTAFYRLRNNAILPYTVLDSNGVAFTQPVNFGKASTFGVEVIASANPFGQWSLNFTFSAYNVNIDDEGVVGGLAIDQLNWNTKLINNFAFFKNSKLQITAVYSSPATIPQGESVEVYYVDLGFQQTIMKGKGRLGLAVTDIFNTQEYGFITYDDNFMFSRIFKLDTRALMLTFGYTFGTAFKEKLMENKFSND